MKTVTEITLLCKFHITVDKKLSKNGRQNYNFRCPWNGLMAWPDWPWPPPPVFYATDRSPVMTTSRSGMSAAGAVMTNDVAWLALTRPSPSPRAATFIGSITMKQNGLPALTRQKKKNYKIKTSKQAVAEYRPCGPFSFLFLYFCTLFMFLPISCV